MKYIVLLGFIIIGSCKAPQAIIEHTPFPVITFDKQTIDIGTVTLGDQRDLVFSFTNTGKAELFIELVTACKCTSIDWPRNIIKPGERGTINVTYDSTGQKLGEIQKTIDIIANTDPIVVEAFFKVNVVLD